MRIIIKNLDMDFIFHQNVFQTKAFAKLNEKIFSCKFATEIGNCMGMYTVFPLGFFFSQFG